MVTNGDFATDSDWSLSGGATISGGTANFTASSNDALLQNSVVEIGNIYSVGWDIVVPVSAGLVWSGSGAWGSQPTNSSIVGSNLEVFTALGENVRMVTSGAITGVSSIDNVSVKRKIEVAP